MDQAYNDVYTVINWSFMKFSLREDMLGLVHNYV